MKVSRRQLRDEWRKNHRTAPRRELGRLPGGVFQTLREALKSVKEERKLEDEQP